MADREHYYVMNNARLIELSDGRLLAPVAVSLDRTHGLYLNQTCLCLISDDGGQTWRRGTACSQPDSISLKHRGFCPIPLCAPCGDRVLHEPGLIERKDGSVIMNMRTAVGHPYQSISMDGGETWSEPTPVRDIVSPCSPQTLDRLPSGNIVMYYNNHPKGKDADWHERFPLSYAISEDDGESYRFRKNIEEIEGRCWAYTASRIHGNQVYLLYYEWYQGQELWHFGDLKLSMIPLEWFC